MQRALVIVGLGWGLVACGPAVEPPVDDGGGSQGTESGTIGSGAPQTGLSAEGATDAGEATTAPPGPSDGPTDDSASGGEELLVPPQSVITDVFCTPQDTVLLFFEVNVMGPYVDCLPAPRPEGYLFAGVLAWDGQPGTFAVGPDAPALAMFGLEEDLTGTLEIVVSEPYHPMFATIDLVGSETSLQGTLDLRLCNSVDVDACSS